MTAIEVVKQIMDMTETSLKDISEYSTLGSSSNICQMLNRNDLKVNTFAEILGVMGFRLVVMSDESKSTFDID
jgi:antitoxin component HigA of HigAB toxin-antitoxin module